MDIRNLSKMISNYRLKYDCDPMRLPYASNEDCKDILRCLMEYFELEDGNPMHLKFLRSGYYNNVCSNCYNCTPVTGMKCDYCVFTKPFKIICYADGLVQLADETSIRKYKKYDHFRVKFLAKLMAELGPNPDVLCPFFNLDPYTLNARYYKFKGMEICKSCFTHVPTVGMKCDDCALTKEFPMNIELFTKIDNEQLVMSEINDKAADYLPSIIENFYFENIPTHYHVNSDFTIISCLESSGLNRYYDVAALGNDLHGYIHEEFDRRNEILAKLRFEKLSQREREDEICGFYEYPLDRYKKIKDGMREMTYNDAMFLQIASSQFKCTRNYNYQTKQFKDKCHLCRRSLFRCEQCLDFTNVCDYKKNLFRSVLKRTKRIKRLSV